MNILYLSLGSFDDLSESSVHIDILKALAKEHRVFLACKKERRECEETKLTEEYGVKVLRIRVGNIKNTNLIEKGISTVLLEKQFIKAIDKFYGNVKFDLVLYETPPVTFAAVVEFVKKRDGAKTYLMLKDIFPQNAVDLGMMAEKGPKSIIRKYFRKKEKQLYDASDGIGCMSEANVRYLLKHNPRVDPEKVEVCPNSVKVTDNSISFEDRFAIREKYGIPQEKKTFVYGGNLGKPQGIPFIIEALKNCRECDAHFLIVGGGTEFGKLKAFAQSGEAKNVTVLGSLPKDDYDTLVAACDVGLIFLDHRFTIPNFPARIIPYMQAHLPVISCTDPNTDVGEIITKAGFGWSCESNDADGFRSCVTKAISSDLTEMGDRGFVYLTENYDAEKTAAIITGFMKK